MLGHDVTDEGERDPPSVGQSPLGEPTMDSQSLPVVRSSSPPVPALMRKLTGLLYILGLHFILLNNTIDYSTYVMCLPPIT